MNNEVPLCIEEEPPSTVKGVDGTADSETTSAEGNCQTNISVRIPVIRHWINLSSKIGFHRYDYFLWISNNTEQPELRTIR